MIILLNCTNTVSYMIDSECVEISMVIVLLFGLMVLDGA